MGNFYLKKIVVLHLVLHEIKTPKLFKSLGVFLRKYTTISNLMYDKIVIIV